MTPEITIVAGTAVDWSKFVGTINHALGRSPTAQLDLYGMAVGNPASYAAALAEFSHKGSNPLTAIKDADKVLQHLTFTFLVAVDKDSAYEILKFSTGVAVLAAEGTKNRENLLMTANLRDWRTAVVEGCLQTGSFEARVFYNAVWDVFDRLGFREAFCHYQRRDLSDKTFSLEDRRR